MGREAEAQISFRGATGRAKLQLEGPQLLCRGEIKAKIDRAEIIDAAIDGDDLRIVTKQGELFATLGSKEAAAWVRALAKPIPSLAQKLGLSGGKRVLVVGTLSDAELAAALRANLGAVPTPADLAICEVRGMADIKQALEQIGELPLWAVTIKGKSSPFSDAAVRSVMRLADYVDTKSCAVSDQMTATRWQKRKV